MTPTAPPAATLQKLLESRGKGLATRRLARQLEDLELAVASITSQTTAQVEKIGANELRCQDLVQRGFMTLVQPKPKPPPKPKGRKGGSRHSKKQQEAAAAAEDDEEEEEALTEVMRLEEQPKCIKGGRMREYQLEGLNWLLEMHGRQHNGSLADEMGLGACAAVLSRLAAARLSLSL